MKNFKPHGLSLIETIILTAVGVVVLLLVFEFAINLFKTSRTIKDTLESIEQGRQTVINFVAELRTAGVSAVGSYPITQATPTAITFFSDIDNDNLREQLRYFVDGNALKRGVLKPTGSPLSYNQANEITYTLVQSLLNNTSVFEYYNASYNGGTQPLAPPVDIAVVRLVKINLIIDRLPSEAPAPYHISSQVNLRNLKDNL